MLETEVARLYEEKIASKGEEEERIFAFAFEDLRYDRCWCEDHGIDYANIDSKENMLKASYALLREWSLFLSKFYREWYYKEKARKARTQKYLKQDC